MLHKLHNQSLYTYLMVMNAAVIGNKLSRKRKRHKHAVASHQQTKQMGEFLTNRRSSLKVVLLEQTNVNQTITAEQRSPFRARCCFFGRKSGSVRLLGLRCTAALPFMVIRAPPDTPHRYSTLSLRRSKMQMQNRECLKEYSVVVRRY